jgi:hypothetical protein
MLIKTIVDNVVVNLLQFEELDILLKFLVRSKAMIMLDKVYELQQENGRTNMKNRHMIK